MRIEHSSVMDVVEGSVVEVDLMLLVVVSIGAVVLVEEDEVDAGSPVDVVVDAGSPVDVVVDEGSPVDVVVDDDAKDVLLEEEEDTGEPPSHISPIPSLSVSF